MIRLTSVVIALVLLIGCNRATPQIVQAFSTEHDTGSTFVVCHGDAKASLESNGKYSITWTSADGAREEAHGLTRLQITTLPASEVPTECAQHSGK